MSACHSDAEVTVTNALIYYCPMLMLAGFFLAPSSSSNNLVAYPLLLALCFKAAQWRNLSCLFKNPIFKAAILLLAYLWLTTFWSVTDEVFKEGLDNLRYSLMIVAFLGSVYFLNRHEDKHLHQLLQCLVLVASCSAALGLWWHWQEHAFLHQRLEGPGRLSNAVVAGFGYGMAALVSLYLIFSQKMTLAKRAVYGVCFIILVIALLSTHTRSAMLAFAASAVVLAPFLVPSTQAKYKWLGALGVLSVVGIMIYLNWVSILRTLAAQNERIEIWTYVLNQLEARPWFGFGLATNDDVPGTKYVYNHPHSVYIATLFYGGIVGLILLAATLTTATWQGLKQLPRQKAAFALSTLCYSVITMGLDGYQVLDKISYIWVIFWLPIVISMVFAVRKGDHI